MGTNASYTRQCSGGGIGGELKTSLKRAVLFCVDIMQLSCDCQRMAAKTRKPLGWAKEKVGRQLIAHEFITVPEMKEALRAFEEHRGIVYTTIYTRRNAIIQNKKNTSRQKKKNDCE